ncbi:MAG: RNA-binding protein [Pseudomonadota bacterium]
MDHRAPKAVERTCVVTRTVQNPNDLIRFVAGPDGVVVPDLAGRLPGRGVWVSATRSKVGEAVEKRLFARGLKAAVTAPETLPDTVLALMEDRALSALSMARKAGECINGFGKVETALAAGRALCVLHAADGADDGVRKLENMRRKSEFQKNFAPESFRIFTEAQMSLALGATNVIHAALVRGGAARACLRHLKKLAAYKEVPPSGRAETGTEEGPVLDNQQGDAHANGLQGEPGR